MSGSYAKPNDRNWTFGLNGLNAHVQVWPATLAMVSAYPAPPPPEPPLPGAEHAARISAPAAPPARAFMSLIDKHPYVSVERPVRRTEPGIPVWRSPASAAAHTRLGGGRGDRRAFVQASDTAANGCPDVGQ